MPLEVADGAENGGDPAATKNYQRLVGLAGGYTGEELELINFLRRLYRNSTPLQTLRGGGGPFVVGGALVFNGANVRIAGDEGCYYRLWKNKSGLRTAPRTGPLSGSSHESIVDQYEIYLEGCGCILVGMASLSPLTGGAHTWFQSEKHAAMGSWGQNILHGLTFVQHVSSGFQQVGAFGTCPYSEKGTATTKNPLVVTNLPPYSYA